MAVPTSVTTDEPRHRLRALYDLAVELSGHRDVATVLDVALRRCLELTGSEFGFIGLVTPEGSAMDIEAIHGFHPAPSFLTRHRRIPLRPSLFARVVLEDCPVRVADARLAPDRVGQPDGHPEVGTFLGVPLRRSGRPIGMIGVANRATPYEDEHEHLTATYAGQISIVIRNAQLNEQLEHANEQLERIVHERTAELHAAKDQLAVRAADLQVVLLDTVGTQEAERQRIAGDLHDGVNQLLIGAMLELESSQQRLSSGNTDGCRDGIASAQAILRQVEGEIRRVVHDLHPPVLEQLGLPAALRRLCEEFTRRHGVPCTAVAPATAALPGRVGIDLYRLGQEALRNVAAHACARTVEVTLEADDTTVTLSVRDDGCGFDPDAVRGPPDHLGVTSMRRRVEALGGRLVLDTALGRGTTVVASVPTASG